MNKLIIFDLDGTLAESKQPLTKEMALLLAKLLTVTNVAVISGGALPQFLTQIVAQLPPSAKMAHLFLLPTSGAALYEYQQGELKKIYEERLSEKEAAHIETVMRVAGTETGYIDFSKPGYGKRIEYRGSQVTLSALGQLAPLKEKKAWDPTHIKRDTLRAYLAERLPEFSVTVGGTTSIDVTKHAIDKAYGVRKLSERLGIPESEALYVGDELREGGNDAAVYKTNVQTKSVTSPFDTATLIQTLLTSA
ncbi:MAG TPA: HAD-IIB family hydrolase [Candidatus Paceibacterota bacterium]|nr:HAD-IIB family hydrolase [Candidatus Paceibacterota bacterium]